MEADGAGQRADGGRARGDRGREEGPLPPSMRAHPGERKRPKRPRKRERKCLIYVLQWAGWLTTLLGANVVLCEAIFRQREVEKGRRAVVHPRISID